MADHSQAIAALIKLFTQLEGFLLRERRVLLEQKRPNLELLAELAQNKTALFDEIAAYPSPESDGSSLWGKLQDLMNNCQQINNENGHLVNQRLKTTSQAISIVKKFAGDNSVALYDPNGGVVHSITSGRHYKA